MNKASVLLLLLNIIALSSDPRVRAQVNPPIVHPGGATWATCHVPRNKGNRKVILSIPFHRSTQWEIEGANAPTMFRFLMQDIPCEAVEVTCRLETNRDVVIDTAPLLRVGC